MTLRSRDISLPTKVHIVKAIVFPVVIFECENWTIKKTEHWRTDVFELWCWRRLESPLDCKEIKPVNPKQINPEYSLEGLMLKLKLQYFGNLMRRTDSLEKTVMLGKIEGRKRRGWLRTRWLDGITDSMDLNVNRLREKVKNREAWHSPWSRWWHPPFHPLLSPSLPAFNLSQHHGLFQWVSSSHQVAKILKL